MLLIFAISSIFFSVAITGPVVYPPQGPVQGLLRDSADGKLTTVFLGIPYARSPVEELRFRRPQPLPAWQEPFPATQNGDACPQLYEGLELSMPSREFYEKYVQNRTYSEDCLNLNIFYPGDLSERSREDEKLAVMVWIHGGGYQAGLANLGTDGDMLAQETGVLVVTINYRLGALGFLALDDAQYPGNLGLWDQRLALQWIQGNIGAFGGDPNRVTIFGESAGGSAVINHLVSPGSAGLLHGAIGMSGQYQDWSVPPIEQVFPQTEALIRELGCGRDNLEEAMTCMRGVPPGDIIQKTQESRLVFGPGAGDEFIPADPVDKIRNGDVLRVPTIWGTTIFEFGLFAAQLFQPNPMNRGMTADEIDELLDVVSVFYNNPEPVRDELIAYYFPDGTDDVLRNLELGCRMMTDWFFESSKAFMLDSMSGNGETTFEFSFQPRPSFMPVYQTDFGGFHGDEIYLVFGEYVYTNGSRAEMTLSRSMMHAWGTFAQTGEPSYLDDVGAQQPWPEYNLESKRYLKFDLDMSRDAAEGDFLLTENKRLFLEILPEIGNGMRENTKMRTLAQL